MILFLSPSVFLPPAAGAVEGAVEVGQQVMAAVLDYSRAEGNRGPHPPACAGGRGRGGAGPGGRGGEEGEEAEEEQGQGEGEAEPPAAEEGRNTSHC